jgi:CheY-like chemotaxis protein
MNSGLNPSTENDLREIIRCVILGGLSQKVGYHITNYFTGVLGYTSLAHQFYPENPKVKQYIERILQCCRDSIHLTSTIITLGEQNVSSFQTPEDAHKFIQDIVSTCHTLFQPECSVRLAMDPNHPLFEIPGMGLKDLLIFLLLISLDSCDLKQEVTVQIRSLSESESQESNPKPTWGLITIQIQQIRSHPSKPFSDTQGIPRQKINTFAYEIGIHAVKSLVELWGGELKLTYGIKNGTLAELRFPIKQIPVQYPLEDSAVPKIPSRPSRSYTVLMLDDQPRICEFIKSLLEEKNHKTLIYQDPIQLENTLPDLDLDSIDLFLLELLFPSMKGLDIAQKIREKKPESRIVFCSALADKKYLEKMYQFDAKAEFLQKPFQNSELIALLENLTQENRSHNGNEPRMASGSSNSAL